MYLDTPTVTHTHTPTRHTRHTHTHTTHTTHTHTTHTHTCIQPFTTDFTWLYYWHYWLERNREGGPADQAWPGAVFFSKKKSKKLEKTFFYFCWSFWLRAPCISNTYVFDRRSFAKQNADPWVHVFDYSTGKEIECLKGPFSSSSFFSPSFSFSKVFSLFLALALSRFLSLAFSLSLFLSRALDGRRSWDAHTNHTIKQKKNTTVKASHSKAIRRKSSTPQTPILYFIY
jgi:hypothetical protein